MTTKDIDFQPEIQIGELRMSYFENVQQQSPDRGITLKELSDAISQREQLRAKDPSTSAESTPWICVAASLLDKKTIGSYTGYIGIRIKLIPDRVNVVRQQLETDPFACLVANILDSNVLYVILQTEATPCNEIEYLAYCEATVHLLQAEHALTDDELSMNGSNPYSLIRLSSLKNVYTHPFPKKVRINPSTQLKEPVADEQDSGLGSTGKFGPDSLLDALKSERQQAEEATDPASHQGEHSTAPDMGQRPPMLDMTEERLNELPDFDGEEEREANPHETNNGFKATSGTSTEGDTADSESIEWPQPVAIESHLLSVLSVTPSMIPEQLRGWLTDIAHRMKCPLDFVATTAVVMLSSLIGTRLTIKPKRRDDWTVVPNLWGALIGGPSIKKTPSAMEVLSPLKRLISESNEQFSQEMKRYEAELATYEAQKKVYQNLEQKRLKGEPVQVDVEWPEPPRKPAKKRYMTNDATTEKLVELLNENPTGLLQFRDELMGLLSGWDRPGREGDRAFYLEAWNGNGSKDDDRIGRGHVSAELICVSLLGGIQPGKLLGYLRAATGYENDGFVQRLQVAVYPDKPAWEYVDDYPDKDARARAFKLIKSINESDFSSISYSTDEYERFPYTRFDADAQEIFKQWLTKWELEVIPSEKNNELLEAHFAKYPSLLASLSLIFHVVNCVDLAPLPPPHKRLVTVEAVTMGIHWCEYLMSHARRIYGLLDTASIESAKELLRHLKESDLTDGFKVRDVYRKQWTHLTTNEQVRSAINELIERHYLTEVAPPALQTKGGRPEDPYYLVNPKIRS
ncbi:YfjI family protein [Spirosoma soli]|uniref:YfjI family protein n=1 Tax=Spirosoma soli TaxID=1770529 RepID=A0ABW5M8V4_9BACT